MFNLSENQTKLIVAAALFATWVALTYFPHEGNAELIGFIKGVLLSLGTHHLTTWQPEQPAVAMNNTPPSPPAQTLTNIAQEGKKE